MFQIAKVKKVDKKVVLFVRIRSLGPKLRYFEDQNGPKRNIFKYKNEFYKQLEWKKKHIERLGDFSSFHVSFLVMVLKFSKKLQFCAELCKKSKFVKAICIYMHLKVPIALFQKMIWFVGVWATIHEILRIGILEMLTQQKLDSILEL